MAQSGTRVTATGAVSTGPTVLWMISGVMTAAGTLTLRDTDGSGTTKAIVDVPAGVFIYPVPFGMAFPGGLHVTFTTATGGATFWL